jgi:hypothetical protein
MTQDLPLMPKATAVWLVDNTTLTFRQIADFCGMHELEVAGIADGEVAVGIKGADPVRNNEVTAEDIKRCEADPAARLKLVRRDIAPPEKKKGPRYTPVSKREDRPAGIAWLVRYHSELSDAQIAKLVGSTKPTIQSIRNRTHWNSANIQPTDPVALGLCKQAELDAAVQAAAERKAKAAPAADPSEDAKRGLLPVEESLGADAPDPDTAFREHASSQAEDEEDAERRSLEKAEELDPEALFSLPKDRKES